MTSINPIYNINYAHSPVFKAKEENNFTPVSNPVPAPNLAFKGTEALRAYNYNLINKNKDFDDLRTIKKLEIPADLTQIGGTPVYNSKGELVLVEKMIGDKKYVYHNNEDKKIEVFDKNGNKISEQICFQNAGDGKTIMVDEFIPGKKDYYSTSYISSDGKAFELWDNMKHVFYPDGTKKEFIYEAKEGKNRIVERDNKNFNYFYRRAIDYDKNNNVEYVSEHADNYSTYKEIKYVDGVPYSVNEDKQTTIKNNVLEKLGVLSDNDLKPHNEFNFLSDAKNIEGEKTYYSNGNVETNTFIQDGKECKYTYSAKGDLINVEFDNIVVECGGEDGYVIHESLGNGIKKDTTYLPDGSYNILYIKDDTEKRISYIDGKVSEYNYSVNGIGTTYIFDQDGNLKDVYKLEYRRD